jgi:hypothetical protein
VRASVRDLFLRSALDNRMTLAPAHPANLNQPGGLIAFRQHVTPFLKGTAPTRLSGARLTTYQTTRLSTSGLEAWRAEADALGFAEIAFAYVCDEPHFFPVYGASASNWKRCEVAVAGTNALWPEVPKLITSHIQSTEAYGTTRLVDVMVVNVELLDGPPGTPWFAGSQRPLYDPFLQSAGRRKELWVYTACGSHGCSRNNDPYSVGWAGYEIDAPASETRALAWLAFSYDLSGTLYFDTTLQLARAWDDQYRYTGNGEGTLFYPGTLERIGGRTPIPIESIRMKLVRDGYEDYEYLRFLSEHGADAKARSIARELFPAAYDTARTDEQLQSARRALAAEVARLAAGG